MNYFFYILENESKGDTMGWNKSLVVEENHYLKIHGMTKFLQLVETGFI